MDISEHARAICRIVSHVIDREQRITLTQLVDVWKGLALKTKMVCMELRRSAAPMNRRYVGITRGGSPWHAFLLLRAGPSHMSVFRLVPCHVRLIRDRHSVEDQL